MTHPRDFDSDYPKPSVLGESEPTTYNDYGNRFEVLPTPDQDYTAYLKCSILPVALSAGSSVPALVRKDRLIVALATMYCFEALQEPQLAMHWQNIVNSAYAKALEGDRKPKDWTPQARPFNPTARSEIRGQTWLNPFVKR